MPEKRLIDLSCHKVDSELAFFVSEEKLWYLVTAFLCTLLPTTWRLFSKLTFGDVRCWRCRTVSDVSVGSSGARIGTYIFVMVPKWKLAVARLVTRGTKNPTL